MMMVIMTTMILMTITKIAMTIILNIMIMMLFAKT